MAQATPFPALGAASGGPIGEADGAKGWVCVRSGGWRVWGPGAAAREFVEQGVAELPGGEGRRYFERPIGGERGFVKVYNRRAGHGLIRRLKSGRAAREAAGYAAFARAGLRTARLLLWGEERRGLLLERGVVATAFVEAATVAQAVERGGAARELVGLAAAALARVHDRGLAHGDPRTRNFFATEGEATVFDLCSWGRLTGRALAWDLVQFVGSCIALTRDEREGEAALRAYERSAGRSVRGRGAILRDALAYARREGAA